MGKRVLESSAMSAWSWFSAPCWFKPGIPTTTIRHLCSLDRAGARPPYTLGQWREIAAYFRQRNARYGALAGLGVIVVLGILIAVNYLSTRRNTRWDLTANRQYSLSEQTVKLVQGLKAPVKFTVFEQPENFDRFRPRLESCKYSSSQVQVEHVDALKNPMLATAQKVDTIPTVLIDYMGRTERVSTDSEQDLTNALIKLLNPTMRKVYFLSGHGEKDPGSSGAHGVQRHRRCPEARQLSIRQAGAGADQRDSR